MSFENPESKPKPTIQPRTMPKADNASERNEKDKNKKQTGKEAIDAKFKFGDLTTAQEYLAWKKTVPIGVRQQVETVMKGNEPLMNQTGLVLSDQFLTGLGKCLTQSGQPDLRQLDLVKTTLPETDKRVSNLLLPLERIETKGGYLNVFETLRNPDVSWNLKQGIFETQIKPALNWLVEKDLERIAEESKRAMKRKEKPDKEQEERASKNQTDNDLPPESDSAKTSMETQSEKKEDEPNAFFSVKPFYGGYFRQAAYQQLNPKTFEWEKGEDELKEPEREDFSMPDTKILSGKIRGKQVLSLPLPYDWVVVADSVETDAPGENVRILRNQNGDWHLQIDGEGVFNYQLRIAPRQSVEIGGKFNASETDSDVGGKLDQKLKEKIDGLKKENLPRMKLAREIVKFIRGHLLYLSGNAESVAAWQSYTKNPAEFFQRIWEQKKADCFVANTLAVRALVEAGLKTRFVGGFFVKAKSQDGAAIMHSGNGHGWLEVWDDLSQRAVRLDATPKGDPSIDEEQQEKDLEGETGDGDYGENEEELMSKEELQEKIKKMKRQAKEKGKQGEVTPAELEEARFAKLAECSPQQAKEFFKALDRVRKIKNERGISISDLLKDEWKKIITERKVETDNYKGPVRMDEGDNLEDPVSAIIDIRSKEFNPTGFEKLERTEKIETDFGGLNIYFSFDLSGSMKWLDKASGRSKADVQRDVALLFVDSLMQCAYISRQQGGNSDLLPIKIMVTLASDTGDVKLNLTDKWGPKEQWAFYSALNRTAKGGTPTHKTLQKIEIDFDKELADLKKKKVPEDKLPLHYTVEISDGDPDNFSKTEAMHERLKAKGMAIRSYCIGGASKSADAAEPIESFSQLPEILSRDIIEKFTLLNPRRIRS